MKKILALLSFLVACSCTSLMAQYPGGGQQMDPAAMKERMKQTYKDQIGLTDVQADSVATIVMDGRSSMRGLRDLSPEERQTKMAEYTAARDKRLDAALPKDVAQKVKDFLAQQRQRMGQGRPQGHQ